jgi:hypothetical protein
MLASKKGKCGGKNFPTGKICFLNAKKHGLSWTFGRKNIFLI